MLAYLEVLFVCRSPDNVKRWSSSVRVLHSQVPRKQVVEKPIRAVEREILAMEKKNLTYTLLEDSDGELDAPAQNEETGRKKRRDKDKGSKRKHIRQKHSESSSEDDAPKKLVSHIILFFFLIRWPKKIYLKVSTTRRFHKSTFLVCKNEGKKAHSDSEEIFQKETLFSFFCSLGFPIRSSALKDQKVEQVEEVEEEEEWEREERERLQDIEERDAFAERVKLKDKDKTRNIAERTDKKVPGLLTTEHSAHTGCSQTSLSRTVTDSDGDVVCPAGL